MSAVDLPRWSLALVAALAQPVQAEVLQERSQRFQPQWSPAGMVASQEQLASRAGAAVLARGGNAVDGAVATAFALAVTLPQAGNLGGGGFLVLWLPGPSPAAARGCSAAAEIRVGRGTAVAVNFRETAPLAAMAGMFLGPDGEVDRQRATRSPLSVAVPGTPAGLLLAQRCYGRLSRASVMAPAIRLASRGFPVGKELADSLRQATPLLQADPTSTQLFLQRPLRPGTIWRQPLLAASLQRIANQGERGFYQGPIAESLVALMRQRGGLIRQADLDGYRAQLVRPLQARFQGYPVVTMPPPSGGGVTLVQLLQVLEPMPLAQLGLNSAASLHRMVEAMNLAYRDRNQWLGDPDQVAMPLERLLSPAHADRLRGQIRLDRHRPAADLAAETPSSGGTNTTHLSVADPQGGLVALTTTLNFAYGSGISVPGAGFLLNNEMDDFTAKPGVANAYGLVQGSANAIAPGKRPLSSMTPTLVFRRDGRPWLATGSPGGSRIITTVLQVLLNRLVHGLNLASAVASPRIHSQLWPDQVSVEQGLSPDTLRLLEGQGHRVVVTAAMGSANSVEVLAEGGSLGVADPRRLDAAAIGELQLKPPVGSER
ncbi:gamma-glutamyltransferase [Cyanobium sp. FACHB-13342]|uniref:gamma-glutamyltransferase n=1 Tax=Cyanobium sp. FACHB-13342 TaxID=2692793 RepID=UPI00168121D7|nr:gamma-glutamyltransferase [Cyanobium sp. FACHB-13342]MBD2424206.1 gamma-glutamyltransferase [Cyanobium sp. FACHB-13342]